MPIHGQEYIGNQCSITHYPTEQLSMVACFIYIFIPIFHNIRTDVYTQCFS